MGDFGSRCKRSMHPSHSESNSSLKRPALGLVLLFSALAGLIAISHDSLWIDEAYSARYAVQATPAAL